MRQNQRFIIIDEFIRSKDYPNSERLAGKIGTDKRTVERDIKTMREELEAPIKYCRLNKGFYYTEPNYFLPALVLTEGEVFGILLAQKLLREFENTPYEERLRSSFMKLQKYLPEEFELEVGRFQDSCSFDLGFVRKIEVNLFEELIWAISEKKRLKIYYYSIYRNERSWRTVDPYHMKNYKGEWYLAAYCHKRNAILPFSPIRIEKWEATGETFYVKEGFSPVDFWKKSFGIYKDEKVSEVVVRIDEYQSRWTKEIIFESDDRVLKVENHKDGSMTVRFRVEGLEEIKRWIMQYGYHMEVIEPESFRNEIKEDVKRMIGRYERNPA